MDKKFHLKIVTPEKIYEEKEIDRLTVLTSEGEVTILPNHVEYLANIEISVLTVANNQKEKHYAVGGGAIHFIESTNTAVLVLNSIIAVENIDVEKLEHRVKAYLQYEKIHKINGEFVSLKCDTIHFKNLNILKIANSLVKPSPVNYNKVQASGWV